MNSDSTPATENSDERELIRDLKGGDAEAYATIYHRYFKQLYSYCSQFTKSGHDAEDIVQDVFTKLWATRESIRQEDSVKGLLFTIARNDLVSTFRRMVASPLLEDYMDYVNTLGREDASGIEYREFVDRLTRVVGRLPSTQQRVFKMSKLEHLTNREIAEHLGINEQSVKNSLHMALKFIRSKFKDLLVTATMLFMLY